MNPRKSYFFSLQVNKLKTGIPTKLLFLLFLFLSSCSSFSPKLNSTISSPDSASVSESPAVSQKAPSAKGLAQQNRQANQSTAKNPKTVSIAIYKLDNQCKGFVSEKVLVSADQPITKAIAKVLENTDSGDFSLAGYRVNVALGVATIDLRLPPNSKRRFNSLSNCEQLALFGSVRRTLINNKQWKIKTVKFTDRGKAIVL
ncbi:hypothetical protein [Phormidesmis priestleyi]